MPTARFFKLPEERRGRILDVALEEFARHGYQKASLNHIIAGAGLSKGAVYYYFDNKADLFITVVSRLMDRFPQIVQKKFDIEDPSKFWTIAHNAFHQIIKLKLDPTAFALLREVIDPEISAMFPEHLREMMQFSTLTLTRFVQTGRRLGVIRQDLPVHLLVHMIQGFMMSISTWLLELMAEGRSFDPDGLTGFLLEFLRRFLDPGQEMTGPALEFVAPFLGEPEKTKSDFERPSDWIAQLQLAQMHGRDPQGV
ncbi:TetR/AcrR family transcriptional regulator [Myxococcota bacterium]|nr:TetR/AcrR family transcriptional regulator [Myxococcota bacterium]